MVNSKTDHFQCYGGDGGFVERAWYGHVGGKEPPPKQNLGDPFKQRISQATDPVRTLFDTGEIREADSLKRTGILIGGTLLGYSVGESVRYAVSARKCPRSVLSP